MSTGRMGAAGMSPANAYWTPPPLFQKPMNFLRPVSNTTGYSIVLPFQDPVCTPHYYGENPVYGRREYAFNTLPEMYAVANIMPTSGGIPRINPFSFAATNKRSHSVIPI